MNKNLYIIVAITLFHNPTIISNQTTHHSLKKVKSFFTRNKPEKIDQREFSAQTINSVSINNINGSIAIKTGWKGKKICLKATTKAKNQEGLDNIEIITDTSKNHHLAIGTRQINKKLAGSVEYELIVPASLDIALNIAGSGDAMVKGIDGNITIVTNDNIIVTNTKKLVSAQTRKKGSIFIAHAAGPVKAVSHQGNIIGDAIANSFSAHSTTGKVNVTYKTVPSTSSINLETASGNIMLALPTDTNAEIRGHTKYGTLISDHLITLKPQITKLDSFAWNRYRKEVDGTLGSGEATIALRSTNGNLKITETKMT